METLPVISGLNSSSETDFMVRDGNDIIFHDEAADEYLSATPVVRQTGYFGDS